MKTQFYPIINEKKAREQRLKGRINEMTTQANFLKQEIEIKQNNNIATVSTLEVAKKFNKKHKDVLRITREVIATVDKNFTERNFTPSEYIDVTGRKLPAYNLTKNAFVLVVMGFTGKEAMAWKIKFIEAFEYLERQYLEKLQKSNTIALPAPKSEDTLTSTLKALELTQKGLTLAEAGRVISVAESTLRGRVKRIKKAMLPIFISRLQTN